MNTTMKKLTAILAASCLLASLAACKGPETGAWGNRQYPSKYSGAILGIAGYLRISAIRRRRFGIQQSFRFQ